jgi:5-bromo-4-chloroindolyl phosphate hydrolysis protein
MGNNVISKVAAGAGAACVFVGGLAGLPFNFLGDVLVSTPLAAVTGMGIWYFWPGRRPITKADVEQIFADQEKLKNATGISQKEVVDTIKLVSDKLDRILMDAAKIRSPNTVRRIKHIDAVGRKIIEDFRQDPSDIKRAQMWIHSYLDQTTDCVMQYAQLSRNGARSIEAQRQMAQFDELLDLIHTKSQELLDHLLTNDTTNMQVNVEVFRDMLNNEGIK